MYFAVGDTVPVYILGLSKARTANMHVRDRKHITLEMGSESLADLPAFSWISFSRSFSVEMGLR
jgi:hypothetical protein